MKKFFTSLFLLVTFLILAVGCAHKKNSSETTGLLEKENEVKFKVIYSSDPMGFDDVQFKSISENTILMLNEEEINQFIKENSVPNDIVKDINVDKAELFMQFSGDKSHVKTYEITNIKAKGNKLTVFLKVSGTYSIRPVDGFNGVFKTFILAELDKEFLSDDMEMVVEISD